MKIKIELDSGTTIEGTDLNEVVCLLGERLLTNREQPEPLLPVPSENKPKKVVFKSDIPVKTRGRKLKWRKMLNGKTLSQAIDERLNRSILSPGEPVFSSGNKEGVVAFLKANNLRVGKKRIKKVMARLAWIERSRRNRGVPI